MYFLFDAFEALFKLLFVEVSSASLRRSCSANAAAAKTANAFPPIAFFGVTIKKYINYEYSVWNRAPSSIGFFCLLFSSKEKMNKRNFYSSLTWKCVCNIFGLHRSSFRLTENFLRIFSFGCLCRLNGFVGCFHKSSRKTTRRSSWSRRSRRN